MSDLPEDAKQASEPSESAEAPPENRAVPENPAGPGPELPPAPPALAAPQPPIPAAIAEKAPAAPKPSAPASARPMLAEEKEPLYRETRGFRLRMDPPDLARLRELPGSRGKTDRELGEEFFEKQADRLAESLEGDVPAPAEVRVVVDPYSRQAFLAVERTIRSILSF